MKKVIFFVMLIMLTFSCRTSKSVIDTTAKINSVVVKDINAKKEISTVTDKAKTIFDKSITTDNINETVTEIAYTAPDSAGKQYVTKKTITNKTYCTRKATNIVDTEKVNNKSEDKSIVVDKTKNNSISQVATVKKDTVKIRSPGAVNWIIIIPIVVALIFVYLFLKKRKII